MHTLQQNNCNATPHLWPSSGTAHLACDNLSSMTLLGVDEAGRGPLAGPVVAGACIIPAHVQIEGIKDSKKMTALQREAIYNELTNHPEVLCST